MVFALTVNVLGLFWSLFRLNDFINVNYLFALNASPKETLRNFYFYYYYFGKNEIQLFFKFIKVNYICIKNQCIISNDTHNIKQITHLTFGAT